MKKDKRVHFTLWVTPEIRKWLIKRAGKNERSFSGEAVFLFKQIMRQDMRGK